MMIEATRLNSLLGQVADATVPERSLFAEVFSACSGKQHPDIEATSADLARVVLRHQQEYGLHVCTAIPHSSKRPSSSGAA